MVLRQEKTGMNAKTPTTKTNFDLNLIARLQIRKPQIKITKQSHFKNDRKASLKKDLRQKISRTEHLKTNPFLTPLQRHKIAKTYAPYQKRPRSFRKLRGRSISCRSLKNSLTEARLWSPADVHTPPCGPEDPLTLLLYHCPRHLPAGYGSATHQKTLGRIASCC